MSILSLLLAASRSPYAAADKDAVLPILPGESTDKEDTDVRKRKIAPNYGRYRTAFKEICELVAEDGRRDALVLLVASHNEADPECLACKPFFLTFAGSCRAPHKKTKAIKTPVASSEQEEEEPAPTLAQPQNILRRNPNTALLDSISQCFFELAENEEDRAETLRAVKKLTGILSDPDKKSNAEAEYFSTIAEFMRAPFSEYELELERETAARTDTPKEPKKEDLNSLFE